MVQQAPADASQRKRGTATLVPRLCLGPFAPYQAIHDLIHQVALTPPGLAQDPFLLKA